MRGLYQLRPLWCLGLQCTTIHDNDSMDFRWVLFGGGHAGDEIEVLKVYRQHRAREWNDSECEYFLPISRNKPIQYTGCSILCSLESLMMDWKTFLTRQ
jgi:hypothetical protein